MDGDQTVVNPASKPEALPKPLLSVADGIFLMVGMVIGVGIFKAPSDVAGFASSTWEFLGVWLLGGLVSLCGALVYAELSARHPETGGEYAFLQRGYSRGVAFVFAWSRMTVIQTGAIAAVAFVFGEYASQVWSLGRNGAAIYAALGVAALTGVNIAGTLQTKSLQRVMETVLITGLLMLAAGGLLVAGEGKPAPAAATGGTFGLAMMFVFFTYGGWNEVAYLAGEVRDAPRNMMRILVIGIVTVTLLYLLVNIGYLAALGLGGMRESKAVAVDVMRLIAGDEGALVLALIVCISAFTTMNAAIFTGARTTWAFARDFRVLGGLGSWREAGSTPANALLLQGVVTLALVLAASFTPDGFSAMVAYTSPVFWTFFLLTGLTLFRFRSIETKGGKIVNQFRVPLYPVVPLVFSAMCAYMLYRSIDYIRNPDFGPKFGDMVLAGIVVMAIGIPLYFILRKK